MMFKTFSGRVNRLSLLVAGLPLSLIMAIFDKYKANFSPSLSVLAGIIELFLAFVVISIEVRRFHDINKKGWWVLTSLIPLFNIYILILLYFQAGTPGDNRFGSAPQKGIHI